MTAIAPNYDADVHDLKGKILELENQLPEFDKFKKFVVDTLDDESFQKRLTGLTKQRIDILKACNRINTICTDFKACYNKIIESYRVVEPTSFLKIKMDDLENKKGITGLIRSMEKIKMNLADIQIEIDEHILLAKELRETDEPSVDPSSTVTNVHLLPETRKSSIKLTSVDVPAFHGEPENFVEFISAFDELVHNNDELAEIEKGIRLKQCLKGRAEMCIKGIPITKDNYAIMYSKLKRKFETATVNKHAIVQKLENLTVSGDSAPECNDKLNEIEVILNQLNTAESGISDSTNVFFHRLILQKFPSHIRKALIGKTKSSKFTVQNLIDALENKIFDDDFVEQAEKRDSYNFTERLTAQYEQQCNLHNEKSRNVESPAYICILCEGIDHDATECRLPIRAKLIILKEKRLCWKCFKPDHASFRCSLPTCACGRSHHPTLCQPSMNNQPEGNNHHHDRNNKHRYDNTPFNNKNITSESSNVPTYQQLASPEHHENGNFSSLKQISNYHSTISEVTCCVHPPDNFIHADHNIETNLQISNTSVNKPVLLTASVKIANGRCNNDANTAVILFDTGSQYSFVREQFAERVRFVRKESIEYEVLGLQETSEKVSGHKVDIGVYDRNGKVKHFEALTKEFLSYGFPSAKLSNTDKMFVKENDISLITLDLNGGIIIPDIIVGADYYNEMIQNEPSLILPSGLHLVKTVFGVSLFGKARSEIDNDERSHIEKYVYHEDREAHQPTLTVVEHEKEESSDKGKETSCERIFDNKLNQCDCITLPNGKTLYHRNSQECGKSRSGNNKPMKIHQLKYPRTELSLADDSRAPFHDDLKQVNCNGVKLSEELTITDAHVHKNLGNNSISKDRKLTSGREDGVDASESNDIICGNTTVKADNTLNKYNGNHIQYGKTLQTNNYIY